MALTWTLSFINGDRLVIDAPPMARSRHIQAYYHEIRGAYEVVFHSSPPLDKNPVALDAMLYPQTSKLCSKLAHLLAPEFDPDQLTPESRYEFFVASKPIEHPDYSHPIPGLSGLEQLLGLSPRRFQSTDEGNTQITINHITSGDTEIDLTAELLLAFPGQALELTRLYPIEFLAKLVRQTAERSRGDAAVAERQHEKDRLTFEKNQGAIESEFRKMGALGMPF